MCQYTLQSCFYSSYWAKRSSSPILLYVLFFSVFAIFYLSNFTYFSRIFRSTDKRKTRGILCSFLNSNSATGTTPLVSKYNWIGIQVPSFHPFNTISHRVVEVREGEDLILYTQNVLECPKEKKMILNWLRSKTNTLIQKSIIVQSFR